MNRSIASLVVLWAYLLQSSFVAPAYGTGLYGDLLKESGTGQLVPPLLLVGTSVEGHHVGATILFVEATFGGIGNAPGTSIDLGVGLSWTNELNGGLTVDGTSYPTGTPPYVFPRLTPNPDGIHGNPVGAGIFTIAGSVIAPPQPPNPNVQQTVTISAPFTYSAIDVMESLANPSQVGGPPLLVTPLFVFSEPGGSGRMDLKLTWVPGGPGRWDAISKHYRFSTVPADLNLDGITDISDVQFIAARYLTTNSDADANGDGFVDISDVQAIALHWLNAAGQGANSATVPEPSACVLAALGLAGWAACGWRRRKR